MGGGIGTGLWILGACACCDFADAVEVDYPSGEIPSEANINEGKQELKDMHLALYNCKANMAYEVYRQQGQRTDYESGTWYWTIIKNRIVLTPEGEKYMAKKRNIVTSAKIDHACGLCGKPDVPENTPLQKVQEKPAHCLCCGSEMRIVEPTSVSMAQLGVYALVCDACPKRRKSADVQAA